MGRSPPIGKCDGWLLKSCCFEGFRLGFRILAFGVIVHANDRTGSGWRIGDFYHLLSCCLYGVVPTLKFSDPMGLPHINSVVSHSSSPRLFMRTLTL